MEVIVLFRDLDMARGNKDSCSKEYSGPGSRPTQGSCQVIAHLALNKESTGASHCGGGISGPEQINKGVMRLNNERISVFLMVASPFLWAVTESGGFTVDDAAVRVDGRPLLITELSVDYSPSVDK